MVCKQLEYSRIGDSGFRLFVVQVEFFNPDKYEGEMGSQQPADR